MQMWRLSNEELKSDDDVRAIAKVATGLKAIPLISAGETLGVTTTKFGGTPYAEAGDVWPTLCQRPYDFVAQLNLRDSFAPPTAAYDLITVFVSWMALEELQGAEFDEVLDKVCLVRSYRDPSEEKAIAMTKPQPANTGDFRVIPCAAESRQVLSYPSPYGSSFLQIPSLAEIAEPRRDCRPHGFLKTLTWICANLFWPGGILAAQDAYIKSLKRVVGYNWRSETSQIGGYPSWVQSDSFDDDEDLFFIAQIAHEPLANFCIGDAAPLFIAAHHSDPARFECDPFQSH